MYVRMYLSIIIDVCKVGNPLDLEQAAKMASQAKPSFVQNPKSASSSQAKLWKKLALKKWQAQTTKLASQAKPQAFSHLKTKLISSVLEPSLSLAIDQKAPNIL